MNVHRRVVLALAPTVAGTSTAAAADRLTGMWNVLEVEVQGRPLTVLDIALEDRALTLTQRGAGKVARYMKFEY